MTIVEALKKVINTEDLTIEEMTEVMNQIMSGNATNAQIAAFLVQQQELLWQNMVIDQFLQRVGVQMY